MQNHLSSIILLAHNQIQLCWILFQEIWPLAPTTAVLNPKVQVQSFGSLPTTKNWYQFMISILDTASTYMHLVTMPNNTLSTLVNALLEYWLCQIGFPDKKPQIWDPKQFAKINCEITWQLTNRNTTVPSHTAIWKTKTTTVQLQKTSGL